MKLTDKHFSFPPFCEPVLLLLGEALPLLLHGPVLLLFVSSYLHTLNFRHIEGIVVQKIAPYLPTYVVVGKTLWESEGMKE